MKITSHFVISHFWSNSAYESVFVNRHVIRMCLKVYLSVCDIPEWMDQVCMRVQAGSMTGQGYVLSVHWMKGVYLCVWEVSESPRTMCACQCMLLGVFLDRMSIRHELRGTCAMWLCVCWVCKFLLLRSSHWEWPSGSLSLIVCRRLHVCVCTCANLTWLNTDIIRMLTSQPVCVYVHVWQCVH